MNTAGFYELTSGAIASGENTRSLGIANFQQETMKLAQEAMDRFRLDERGAVLKSEAYHGPVASKGGPRQFIFDKPFLILLEREDAAQPYFALWVDNAELLAPYK